MQALERNHCVGSGGGRTLVRVTITASCFVLFFRLRNQQAHSPTARIAMEDIDKSLDLAVRQLSDENYACSLTFYHFWFDIGQTYHRIPPTKFSMLSGTTKGRVRR